MSDFASVSATLATLYKDLHHDWYGGTVANLTPEMAHWTPPPRTVPIAGHIAHAVLSEDLLLCSFAFHCPPLAMSTHADSGISEMMPFSGAWDEWARRVQVDLARFQTYASAVFANTESRVAALTTQDLERIEDLTSVGMARQPVGSLLLTLAAHIAVHTGEVSAIKGLQDAKGYAF